MESSRAARTRAKGRPHSQRKSETNARADAVTCSAWPLRLGNIPISTTSQAVHCLRGYVGFRICWFKPPKTGLKRASNRHKSVFKRRQFFCVMFSKWKSPAVLSRTSKSMIATVESFNWKAWSLARDVRELLESERWTLSARH